MAPYMYHKQSVVALARKQYDVRTSINNKRPSQNLVNPILFPYPTRLRLPPKSRMLPIQILHLLLRHARELLLGIPALTLLVVRLHPQQRERGHNQHGAAARQVEPVADRVVGPIVGQVAPCGDEAADVAHHDWEKRS